MAILDHLRRTTVGLPGSEERTTTGGAACFVRGKLYAWECHPWPSFPADIRETTAAELVVGVKVADRLDALALIEMAPNVFLRTTTTGASRRSPSAWPASTTTISRTRHRRVARTGSEVPAA